MYYATQNCMTEWSFASSKTYHDPFNEVTLDVMFTDPDGEEHRAPAFWAGERTWRVRYTSPKVGAHRWRSVCSDTANPDLHGREGVLEVKHYQGDNPLMRHGALQMSANRRYLEHLDGTPFFWLGDTWWMGLCRRLRWPGDFQRLTADRVEKGFSVIQIVAGIYPDMPAFDERGMNEVGFPWEKDFTRINPAYFDMADLRIDYLVQKGLVPCIFGCWGYYLVWMGVEKMKQHWRYLVARYGAYPVVWSLAGEGSMPYYLSESREKDQEFQKKGWTELGAYLRNIDPYHHPVTIHPGDTARNVVEDPSLLDIDMLQTGHGDRGSIPNTIRLVKEGYVATPTIPVINGEVCYEGIGEACRQEVQRFMFWVCMLSGACGHTYGANGIWQVNTQEQPYGPSPHGMSWGDTPWDAAYQLPGSKQLGLGKQLLQRYDWWRFEPHPEWVENHATAENYNAPYAGGIPGKVRVIFLPSGVWGVTLKGIEAGIRYRAFLFNPTSGQEQEIGAVTPEEQGNWRLPLSRAPIYQDWVLVLEASE
ncbi:TPA: DUF4038 domain-containing protein [Candidatus Poribacteria bacterium]|nr:DUF4038 domain-containing protein [Candidatus Poribacteria bacterium]